MLRIFLLLLTTLFVFPVSAEDLCARACEGSGGTCTLTCKSGNFEVRHRENWANDADSVDRSKTEGQFSIDAHLISGRIRETGANCPIASLVNVDPKAPWIFVAQGTNLKESAGAWAEVFRKAGLKLEGGQILKWKGIDENNRLVNTPGFDGTWNKDAYVLIEITFRLRSGGALYRARQAMYFRGARDFSGGVSGPTGLPNTFHAPARMYFLNCTALASSSLDSLDGDPEVYIDQRDVLCRQAKHAKEPFCGEKEDLDLVFSSFTPLACVSAQEARERHCAPTEQVLMRQELDSGLQRAGERQIGVEDIVSISAVLSSSAIVKLRKR